MDLEWLDENPSDTLDDKRAEWLAEMGATMPGREAVSPAEDRCLSGARTRTAATARSAERRSRGL